MSDSHQPTPSSGNNDGAAEFLRLRSATGSLTATVDRNGARIAQISFGADAIDLLATTPWAGTDWSGAAVSTESWEEWHRRYSGGWDVLVPHAGDARELNGVQHPFHGEAAWRRWTIVEQTADSCTFEVQLRTAPLQLTRTVSIHGDELLVRQTIRNFSAVPTSFSWTEHPAFGPALLDPSTTVEVDGRDVVVDVPDADGSRSSFQTVSEIREGRFTVTNPRRGLRVDATWDASTFPYAYVWQEHRGNTGFPWWGVMDALAVEPASRPYVADADTLGPLTLAGGETMVAEFTLAASFVDLS